MYCMKCGAEIAAETKFCGKCGAGQSVVESPTKAIDINPSDPKAGQKILVPQYTEPQASTSAPRSNVVMYVLVGILVFAVAGGVGYWGWTQKKSSATNYSSAKTEWVNFFEDESFIEYANPSTISMTGDKVKMWFLEDLKIARAVSGNEFFSRKAHAEFDCKEAQSRLLDITVFSGHMGSGNVLENDSNPQSWKLVSPKSMMEERWKFACKEKQALIMSGEPAEISVGYLTKSTPIGGVNKWSFQLPSDLNGEVDQFVASTNSSGSGIVLNIDGKDIDFNGEYDREFNFTGKSGAIQLKIPAGKVISEGEECRTLNTILEVTRGTQKKSIEVIQFGCG